MSQARTLFASHLSKSLNSWASAGTTQAGRQAEEEDGAHWGWQRGIRNFIINIRCPWAERITGTLLNYFIWFPNEDEWNGRQRKWARVEHISMWLFYRQMDILGNEKNMLEINLHRIQRLFNVIITCNSFRNSNFKIYSKISKNIAQILSRLSWLNNWFFNTIFLLTLY